MKWPWLMRIFGIRHRPSPLKIELANLRKRYAADEERLAILADDFWRNGGICCPGCGVPGYTDLQEKQERRLLRISGIEQKLGKND
jgi:hypothetical protein